MAKKPAKKAPLAKRAAAKTPAGRALLKRALADPGLRSKLDIGQLRPEQQASRKLTARLAAPVVPGSSMTEGQLASSSKLQGAVKYGPAEAELKRQTAEAQQQARDVGGPGGFYDQYLAKLAQNSQQQANIGTALNTGLQGIGQGITGLGASSLQSLQSAADADAAARGATAGDQSQYANQAATTRQALIGSFQAQADLQNAVRGDYASQLQNVVAPAQRLSAQAQEAGRVRKLREKGLELATEKGTYVQQQRAEGRASEAKNVLAKEIATGKTALQAAGLAETTRSHKAGEKIQTTKIAAAATQKQADADAKAAADAAKASEPNKYGVPADQWAKWSTSHRQRVIAAGKAKTKGEDTTPGTPGYKKKFQEKYGVAPVGTPAVNKAKSTISEAQYWVKQLKGNPGQILNTGQAAKGDNRAIPKLDPLFVRVALDLKKYKGKISAGTANRLHHAGYSVPQLGLATVPATGTTYSKGSGRPD